MAGRLHRYELMRARYQAAVDRSPDDWYANLELGIANSLTGRSTAAGSALRRAVRLNPGEPIARRVLNTFSAGRPIDSDAVDRAFQNQAD
jgi:Flp pilus assembly protein TadD